MFRGFYAAAQLFGCHTQQRKTEMLTNNMANVNTPGFKADQSSIRAFPEMLLQRLDQHLPTIGNSEVGAVNTGVYMQESDSALIQGDLRQTDLRTDLALTDLCRGALFFYNRK